jgi:hypothetical protein
MQQHRAQLDTATIIRPAHQELLCGNGVGIAICRIVHINQVELDWQAAGQVGQPLGIALANIHPGYHGPGQRDPLPAEGVILPERLNEVWCRIPLFDGHQFPPLEPVCGSQRDDQPGAMPFCRKAPDAGGNADRGERDRFGGDGHPARFG